MTIKATLAAIRAMRMSASYRAEYREYRITYPAYEMPSATRREDCACYTNDAQDAIGTATAMRKSEDDRQNGIDEAIAAELARWPYIAELINAAKGI